MRKFLFFVLIFFIFLYIPVFSIDENDVAISPMFLGASETDTLFRNPADLTLYDKVLGGRIHYGFQDKKFGGSLILHMPDWGLGDLAISGDFFGSNFAQNVIWVEDNNGNRVLTVTDGGYKALLTWAKKTRFFTIGINGKYYNYREFGVNDSFRYGLGVDLGGYFTPFKDLYLGMSLNDFGGTIIRNSAGVQIKKINQEMRLMATIVSGEDMSMAVGIPFSYLLDSRDDPNNVWRRMSIQAKKVFGGWLAIGGGYNSKDLYMQLKFNMSDFITLGIIGWRDLTSLKSGDVMYIPNQFRITLSYGIPFSTLNKIKRVINRQFEESPWLVPLLFFNNSDLGLWYFDRHNRRKIEKNRLKMLKMERRIKKLESDRFKDDEFNNSFPKIKDLNRTIRRLRKEIEILKDEYDEILDKDSIKARNLMNEIEDKEDALLKKIRLRRKIRRKLEY